MRLLLISALVLIATVSVSGYRFFDPWWAPKPCPNNTVPAPGWPWWLPGRPCIPEAVPEPPSSGGNGTSSSNGTDSGSVNNWNANGNSTDGGNSSSNGTASDGSGSAGNSSSTSSR
uniref:Putative salivary secreted peptide n=1 Tax=Psorophora albipes TaxID=869069 RepID=T1DJ36_9DIPT